MGCRKKVDYAAPFNTDPLLGVMNYKIILHGKSTLLFRTSLVLHRWPINIFVCVCVNGRNLLANPFNCNCHLAWLSIWLRNRKIVTGNPRCQRPAFLKEIPLQDVALPDFRCQEGTRSSPHKYWFVLCFHSRMIHCSVCVWCGQIKRKRDARRPSSVPRSAPVWRPWSAAATNTCASYPKESRATSPSCESTLWTPLHLSLYRFQHQGMHFCLKKGRKSQPIRACVMLMWIKIRTNEISQCNY